MVVKRYICSEKGVERIRKKPGVFKIYQKPEVGAYTQNNQYCFYQFYFGFINSHPDEIIDEGTYYEKIKEKTADFIIEKQAYQKQIDVSEWILIINEGIS